MVNVSSDAAASIVPRERNSHWYTQARVDELLAEKDREIASLQRHLSQTMHTLRLRTKAMHRVLKRRGAWQ